MVALVVLHIPLSIIVVSISVHFLVVLWIIVVVSLTIVAVFIILRDVIISLLMTVVVILIVIPHLSLFSKQVSLQSNLFCNTARHIPLEIYKLVYTVVRVI